MFIIVELYLQLLIGIDLLVAYYESKFILLQSISQSKTGAVHVLNAGLFQSIRSSGLFSFDLDLGLGWFLP